ncbi:MAG: hypothetical protein ACXAEL_04535 [Candidatus Hodarchaeales archaeon]
MNIPPKTTPISSFPQEGTETLKSKYQASLMVFLCLWLLAFLVRLIWIWPLHYNDWFGDAAYNVTIAEDIADGKDARWVGRDSPFFVFTPLFHLFVALILLVSPLPGMTAAKLVSAGSTSFVPPTLYLLLYRLTEEKQKALTGALIATFVPWFLALSVMTLATGLFIALAVASCAALLSIRGNQRIPASLILAALAALSRPEGAFFLFFTMVWILIMAFKRREPAEWRMALFSVIIVGIGVIASMMMIWGWRAGDPFVWIVSMLGHQADETQKGKLTLAEFGYLAIIILATYSGFGGDPEPVRFDLYNVLRIGFAAALLLLIVYGFWVLIRDWRSGKLSKEIQEGYLFILSSWVSMLIFLILLDGRWIKYHVLGVMMIQPLFVTLAIFDLVKRISTASYVTQRLNIVSKKPSMVLILILSILSIQFLFAFTTNAFLKSQMWEPRRELVEWLNETAHEDVVVVIPHREYYVTAYSLVESINYKEIYTIAGLDQGPINQEQLLTLCQEQNIRYLVTTSDSDRQEDPYYSQMIELLSNRTTMEFSSRFEWRSISIALIALKITAI